MLTDPKFIAYQPSLSEFLRRPIHFILEQSFMTNASLKEQLQALAIVPETTNHKKDHRPKRMQQTNKKAPPQLKPAWLEYAQYGVELLKAYFPLCFRDIKDVQPLKIGIKQDLVKALSTLEQIVIADKACMVSSLSYYVNSTAYHKSVVEGAQRIDLAGAAVGLISAAESDYSAECRKAKLAKKKIPLSNPNPANPTAS